MVCSFNMESHGEKLDREIESLAAKTPGVRLRKFGEIEIYKAAAEAGRFRLPNQGLLYLM